MSRYERLHAWRECHELALAVYRVTKRFPDDERYGLTSQTRRAAFSSEVGYALRFAHEAGLLPDEEWSALNDGQARARFLTWQLYQALGR